MVHGFIVHVPITQAMAPLWTSPAAAATSPRVVFETRRRAGGDDDGGGRGTDTVLRDNVSSDIVAMFADREEMTVVNKPASVHVDAHRAFCPYVNSFLFHILVQTF